MRGALTETQPRFLEAVVALMGAQTRKKRALTIGAVVFLSLLVVASAVALAVIQSARQNADKNAAVAMMPSTETVVCHFHAWNAPRKPRNSETNPARPGRPSEAKQVKDMRPA